MEELKLSISLIPAADDPPLRAPAYQTELREFEQSLTSEGVIVENYSIYLREGWSAEPSTTTYLGDFTVKVLGKVGPPIIAAVAGWLHGRAGRKVHLKVGEIEVDAPTMKEEGSRSAPCPRSRNAGKQPKAEIDSMSPERAHAEAVLTKLSKLGALPDNYVYHARGDLLDERFRSLLIRLRETLNAALLTESANASDGVPNPPLHFDYVDANEQNAIAFQHDNCAFILVTLPMMALVRQTAQSLGSSAAIAHILGIAPLNAQISDRLAEALFSIQLSFLVSHEYTHHAHEHVKPASGAELAIQKEISGEESGRLAQQAQEAAADSYAVYMVLANLFEGDGRPSAALALSSKSNSSPTDEDLLALFHFATGGFFCAFPQAAISSATVYSRSHPPEDVRMNYVIHSMNSWCNQSRPALETWMNLARYQAHMRAVVEAVRGAVGRPGWNAQLTFLLSAPGKEYLKHLEELRLHQFGILKRNSEARRASHSQ